MNYPYFNFKYQDRGRVKGQAILELAIFGSIVIMLLGVLLNYGLRYGYQQQMMQYAFRKALASAVGNSPNPTSHLVARDRHIPNPNDAFGVGSVIPFYSSATVMRSNRLDETADDAPEDMPKTRIDVASNDLDRSVNNFTMADFCYNAEVGVANPGKSYCFASGQNLKKCKRRYEEVYGANNFWRINEERDVLDWETGQLLVDRENIKTNEPPFQRFLQWLHDNLPKRHPDEGIFKKTQPPFIVEIVDYCNGQILDYESAVRQCRLIVDDNFCLQSCERGGSGECDKACSQRIPVPWYCQNRNPKDGSFPELKKLFFPQRTREEAFRGEKAPIWQMGLQAGESKQSIIINNQLDKNEDSENITTEDKFNWNVQTNRKVFYKNDDHTRGEQDVPTDVKQERTRDWQTPW